MIPAAEVRQNIEEFGLHTLAHERLLVRLLRCLGLCDFSGFFCKNLLRLGLHSAGRFTESFAVKKISVKRKDGSAEIT